MDDTQTSTASSPESPVDLNKNGSYEGDVSVLDPSAVDSVEGQPGQDDELTVEVDADELHGPALHYPL